MNLILGLLVVVGLFTCLKALYRFFNNPASKAQIDNEREKNKRRSMIKLAKNMGCDVSELKSQFIKEFTMDWSLCTEKEIQEQINQFAHGKENQANEMNMNEDDTPMGILHAWAIEVNQRRKDNDVKRKIFSKNPDFEEIALSGDKTKLRGYLKDNPDQVNSIIRDFAYADNPVKTLKREAQSYQVRAETSDILGKMDDAKRFRKKVDEINEKIEQLKLEDSDVSRKQKELHLEKLRKDGLSLEGLDKKLKSDKGLVKVAVQQNGLALKFASYHVRGNKEIALLAVEQNARAIRYASKKLRGDKDFVIKALSQDVPPWYSYTMFTLSPWKFGYTDWIDRGNKRFIWERDRLYQNPLAFVSPELREDKAVVLKAVEQGGEALKFASDKLKGDKDVVSAAVNNWPLSIQYASEALQTDSDFSDAYEMWQRHVAAV